VTAICDGDEGLAITLADGKSRRPVAKLVFQDFLAYRSISESFRLKTWARAGDREGGSLMRVQNSMWVKWLQEESQGVLEEFEVVHYAIYTNDDCIDVVSRTPPLVVRSISDPLRV
jgi:hypothetical protein